MNGQVASKPNWYRSLRTAVKYASGVVPVSLSGLGIFSCVSNKEYDAQMGENADLMVQVDSLSDSLANTNVHYKALLASLQADLDSTEAAAASYSSRLASSKAEADSAKNGYKLAVNLADYANAELTVQNKRNRHLNKKVRVLERDMYMLHEKAESLYKLPLDSVMTELAQRDAKIDYLERAQFGRMLRGDGPLSPRMAKYVTDDLLDKLGDVKPYGMKGFEQFMKAYADENISTKRQARNFEIHNNVSVRDAERRERKFKNYFDKEKTGWFRRTFGRSGK